MQSELNNNQPDKDPFFIFYIIWPIQNAAEATLNTIKHLGRKITGAWWCEHCQKYHGRRVHRYTYNNFSLSEGYTEYCVCSLGHKK